MIVLTVLRINEAIHDFIIYRPKFAVVLIFYVYFKEILDLYYVFVFVLMSIINKAIH